MTSSSPSEDQAWLREIEALLVELEPTDRERIVTILAVSSRERIVHVLRELAGTPGRAALIVSAGAVGNADSRAELVAAIAEVALRPHEVRTLLDLEGGVWGAEFATVDAALTETLAHLDALSWPTLPHACELMLSNVQDVRVPLDYYPEVRSYRLTLAGSGSTQTLFHCPFCGVKLPSSLQGTWADRLSDLGVERGEPVPSPYDSDSWWRGDPNL